MDNHAAVAGSDGDTSNMADAALQLLCSFPPLLAIAANGVDACIDDMLAQVGSLVKGARSYVMLVQRNGIHLRNTHEWISPAAGPTKFSWPVYDYENTIPSLTEVMGKDYFYGRAQDMAQDLQHAMNKHGVVAFASAPIHMDGHRIGLVGIDFRDPAHQPTPQFRPVMQALAGLIALALQRKNYGLLRGKMAVICKCVADVEPIIASHAEEEQAPDPIAAKPTTLLDAERHIIIKTLELYNGNKLKTAKHLGLTWPSLDRRCKKLAIEVRRS